MYGRCYRAFGKSLSRTVESATRKGFIKGGRIARVAAFPRPYLTGIRCVSERPSSKTRPDESEETNDNRDGIPVVPRESKTIGTTKSPPSFRVAKVSSDGNLTIDMMRTSEILNESSSIYARDLLSLSIVRKEERNSQLRRSETLRRAPSVMILPRAKEILLSFGSIQAVLGMRSIMLFNAQNVEVQLLSQDLSELLKERRCDDDSSSDHERSSPQEEPFELVVLEFVLQETCDAFHRRIRLYDPIVDSFLGRVENEVFSDSGVHQLVPIKDALQRFEMIVKQSLDCLTGLLNNDEDMLALLLTEKDGVREEGGQLPYNRHEDVELMLEEYARQLSNIQLEINYLLQRIESKSEFVQIALDGYRNRLIRINLYLAVVGLSLGIGTTVAGFFGMNIVHGLEGSSHAFQAIVLSTSILGVAVAGICTNYVSGRTMQLRASERLFQIETLTSALSDMVALDHTVKSFLDSGESLSKEEFGRQLRRARKSGKVTTAELELLFGIMDASHDGFLQRNDFRDLNNVRCIGRDLRRRTGGADIANKNEITKG